MGLRHRLALAVAAVLLLALLASAKEKYFNMPKAFHAKTYPARDEHSAEKVTVAADPYDLPDKTAGVFVIDYKTQGMLPIHVIISNDGDRPVLLKEMRVTLITKGRVRITPSSPEDIYRRIGRRTRRGDEPTRMPLPVPRRAERSIKPNQREEVENSQFYALAVEPNTTRDGFFIFDVDGLEDPLHGARLIFTGLADAQGKDLFYFEIPMEKYLNYQPNQP